MLTYAAETRSDTARTTHILEATEIKTPRRILNKTRIDKIRNERIREICKIQNITSWVQRRMEHSHITNDGRSISEDGT
jgi:hypothetical protein